MRWLLVGVVVGAAIILYALFHAIMAPARTVRALPKGVWILAIIVLPLVGAGLWFWLGAPRRGPSGPARPVQRGLGPDDDPEFLRRLETQRRQKAREEQLNAKESELKAREERLKRQAQSEPKPSKEGDGPSPSDSTDNGTTPGGASQQ
ncbi:MAG: PLDc N-terminal domain-containing protein [Arthrobacter sp.]|jgi:cytochrome c-type biogenesis protein CcmH/NrfG|nr:PLDc N-terminal domain-containing protein [Arthrobacter sp.]